VSTLPPPQQKIAGIIFNDLNVELSKKKRHKKQTFVEVKLERVLRINERVFIRESTQT